MKGAKLQAFAQDVRQGMEHGILHKVKHQDFTREKILGNIETDCRERGQILIESQTWEKKRIRLCCSSHYLVGCHKIYTDSNELSTERTYYIHNDYFSTSASMQDANEKDAGSTQ